METDAAAEGGVDGVVEVGGEEDDAAEVFEFAEEDANEFITMDIIRITLRHEHIRLIQQHDGIPLRRHLKHALDIRAQRRGVDAQVLGLQVEERAVGAVGDGLGGERLAGAGRAGEQDDEALALADNDVLHDGRGAVGEGVVLDKGEDEVFLLVVVDEVGEGLVVPDEGFDVFDVELDWGRVSGVSEGGGGGVLMLTYPRVCS